ncbi:DoxX family protein [Mesohalobacter halotolerans]|uniref:DoxX family protein n=1 Tax=Mesohalobacter halotolerans TaxID=1883405 RepID=A0A4U5TTS7_9FLAO|nr:DoxX family protein [Mesohalobacter halotolerans]MBS3737418.1 DoxX family protein [Psychroflexus sp.]TKS56894.1 hypothetical protein FCN74_00260 [Mesohalobacter halotolerans]
MSSFTFCILLSSISFLGYALAYFMGTKMKNEFVRFGLEKYALITIVFEIIGAIGLLVGHFLDIPLLLKISAIGLTLMMFLGILVRIKVKDGLFVILPAFFFFVLNAFITWFSFN